MIRFLTIALILCSIAATGCGASKRSGVGSGTSNQSSRELPNRNPGSGQLAECNRTGFSLSDATVSASLATYYDLGQIRPDIIQLIITRAPSTINLDGTQYLQIFKWQETAGGGRNMSSSPVQLYFQDRDTGEILNANSPAKSISAATINSAIRNHPSIKAGNFFENVSILMQGLDLSWDAITISLYNSGNQSLGHSDALLPAFSADPNRYIASHKNLDLQRLHPNYNIRNSGATQSQFLDVTEAFCRDFLN